MCCDRYQRNLYRYLRQSGMIGQRRRKLTASLAIMLIVVIWVILVSGMTAGFTAIAYKSRLALTDKPIVTPLANLAKRCASPIDDCDSDPANCVCTRKVDCVLDFPDNITVTTRQTRMYRRCYPEICDPSEFCRFSIGNNYTLWWGKGKWSIESPELRLQTYVAGLVVSALVVTITIIFVTIMSLIACRLTSIWIPLPVRESLDRQRLR